MEGIITLIVIFFVVNSIVRAMKKVGKSVKGPMTQQQIEETKPKPAPVPVQKPMDYRFPAPKSKPVQAKPAPIAQEGREPGAVMSTYTPIAPSMDLNNQFTNYQGSLQSPVTEGAGYQTEAYDETPVPYRAADANGLHILPERFTRDALVQAVVMSEILKRPGVRR